MHTDTKPEWARYHRALRLSHRNLRETLKNVLAVVEKAKGVIETAERLEPPKVELMYECDNCDFRGKLHELNEINDLEERVDLPLNDPELVMPAGECPKCGALAYDAGPEDDPGEPALLNFYECPRCKTKWEDVWSCACNDQCPSCGLKDIEPYESKETRP